jgi:ABC-type transporter Mla MlaB component
MPNSTITLTGAVTLAEVPQLAKRLTADARTARTLDWHAVTAVDSSALTLIFELARQAGHRHVQQHVPAALSTLIHLYGVESFVDLA